MVHIVGWKAKKTMNKATVGGSRLRPIFSASESHFGGVTTRTRFLCNLKFVLLLCGFTICTAVMELLVYAAPTKYSRQILSEVWSHSADWPKRCSEKG